MKVFLFENEFAMENIYFEKGVINLVKRDLEYAKDKLEKAENTVKYIKEYIEKEENEIRQNNMELGYPKKHLGEYVKLQDGTFKSFEEVENGFHSKKIKINDWGLNDSTTFGCGCHVVGDFTVKSNTKTTGKDYLKKQFTKEQIIVSIKGCPKVFNNDRKVILPKDLTKYSKDVLVEILFILNELEFLKEDCRIFDGIEKINKLIEEEERELSYIHSKRIAELELELAKIIKEIELTPKEYVKHKIEMLNKKNEIERKLTVFRAEI